MIVPTRDHHRHTVPWYGLQYSTRFSFLYDPTSTARLAPLSPICVAQANSWSPYDPESCTSQESLQLIPESCSVGDLGSVRIIWIAFAICARSSCSSDALCLQRVLKRECQGPSSTYDETVIPFMQDHFKFGPCSPFFVGLPSFRAGTLTPPGSMAVTMARMAYL